MATIDEITKLIELSNAKLIASINKVNDNLKADILKLSTNINEKFANINKEVELVQQRCDVLEDLSSRQDRRKELIVRNVPVLKDESVATIINTVCSVIGFQSPYGAPVAFRLRGNMETAKATRTTRSQSDKVKEKTVQYPPIILKFATEWDSKVFMDRYYRKASLRLSDVGIRSEDRIYISENLTPASYAIFRLARDMKRTGAIIKTRVQDGIVAVQLPGVSMKLIPVKKIQDLQTLVSLNTESSST